MTTPQKRLYYCSATLGIALLCAISLRYAGLPLWIDELHTSWTVMGEFDSVAERANAGNQSPFYFYLLKCFVALTGHTETALRSFSILCACCSILVLNWLCYTRRLGLLATLLTTLTFATSHIQLLFAVEARSYSLLTLLVLILFCLSCLRWSRMKLAESGANVSWSLEWLWAVVAGLCIYTHYMAIPAVGSLLLAHLLFDPTPWSTRLKTQVFQAGLLSIVIWPQFDALANIYQHRNQWAVFIHANDATVAALFTTLPVNSTLLIPLVGLLVFRTGFGPQKIFLAGVFMLAMLPYLAAWTTTRLDWVNWFFPRYLVTCLPALSLFCGFSLDVISRHTVSLRPAAIVAVSCLCVFLLIDSDMIENVQTSRITSKNEHWNKVVSILSEHAKPEETILLAGGLVEDRRLPALANFPHTPSITTDQYCQFPLRGMYLLPETLNVRSVNSDYRDLKRLSGQIQQISSGWLIVRGRSRNLAIHKMLVRLFGHNGFENKRIPGQVNLYRWHQLK